ncbi:hypothetical protein HDA32_000516 [Spinactinospora alkalitolerans]|uniref:Uncharacterized protein n=1 Tax=Spinactinospora alkalitolerans TaxID=687207 RepID=A0A852TM97_9ACTN|nr:hypothetical protein [Spinactinospora alkalitolerans]NYE45396.1 hypothetical protein [Spinactinospora alkalitolerans]
MLDHERVPGARRARLVAVRGGARLDPLLVGEPLAALADACAVLPAPPFGYVQMTPRDGRSVVEDGSAPLEGSGSVSTRAWAVRWGGRADRVGPVLNNLPPGAVDDAVTEYAAQARRLGDRPLRLVVAVQRFLVPEVTLLCRAAPGCRSVRLRGCWGLAEALDGAPHFDEWLLEGPDLDLRESRVAAKLTATAAGAAGTRRVAVRPGYRVRNVLHLPAVRAIAGQARVIAKSLRRPVEVEVGVRADGNWLLACSPE